MEELLGPQWIHDFKREKAQIWIEMLDNFQSAKCSFYQDVSSKSHNVTLPMEFIVFMQDKLNESNDGDEDLDVEDGIANKIRFGGHSKLCHFFSCCSVTNVISTIDSILNVLLFLCIYIVWYHYKVNLWR